MPEIPYTTWSEMPEKIRRREAREARWAWSWALVIVTCWTGLWFFFPVDRHQPEPGMQRADVPFSYAPLAAEQATDPGSMDRVQDVIRVRGPALFAMPSPAGFSGPFWDQQISFALPLAPPMAQAVFLETPFGIAGIAEDESESMIVQDAATRLSGMDTGPHRGARVFHGGTVFQNRLESVWTGIQPVAGYPQLPEPVGSGVQRWEASVWFVVGPEGRVARALVDSPSPDAAWNASVLRWLYRLSFLPADGERAGRLAVHFEPLAGQ